MQIKERIMRGLKEFLGMKQWPRNEKLVIENRDEFFLSQLVRSGDVVFDIGANHGSLARFMASLCGTNGKVVAFEPVWRVYERICERLQSESSLRAPIITVPLGLSDQAHIAQIHYPVTKWGDALATIAPIEEVRDSQAEYRTLRCGVIPLDMFVQTTGIQQPHLVKIDVEGAECKVLRGGKSVFEHKEQPVVFIELVGPWLRRFGNTLWDAVGYMQSIGYQHLFMCPQGLVEHRSTPDHPIPESFRMGYNVISLIPTRHQWAIERLAPYMADRNPVLPPMDPATLPNE